MSSAALPSSIISAESARLSSVSCGPTRSWSTGPQGLGAGERVAHAAGHGERLAARGFVPLVAHQSANGRERQRQVGEKPGAQRAVFGGERLERCLENSRDLLVGRAEGAPLARDAERSSRLVLGQAGAAGERDRAQEGLAGLVARPGQLLRLA